MRAWLECSAPVGSSASSNRGRVITARATATSCCWPPESWLRVEIFLADDLEPVEQIAHLSLALLRRYVAVLQRQIEVFPDLEIVDQMIVLEDESDLVALQRLAMLRIELLDGDDHRARIRPAIRDP